MDSAAIGLLGVVLGAVLTQLFNRGNAVAARLHEARIEAYKHFASTLMDYRRATMNQWFEDHGIDPPEASDEAHHARSSAWSAYYGVCLLASDPALKVHARELLDKTTAMRKISQREELNREGERIRDSVERFIDAARKDARTGRR